MGKRVRPLNGAVVSHGGKAHTVMQTWPLRQLLFQYSCVTLQRRDFCSMCTRQARNMRLVRCSQACKLNLQGRYSLILCRNGIPKLVFLFTARRDGSWCSSWAKLVEVSTQYTQHIASTESRQTTKVRAVHVQETCAVTLAMPCREHVETPSDTPNSAPRRYDQRLVHNSSCRTDKPSFLEKALISGVLRVVGIGRGS